MSKAAKRQRRGEALALQATAALSGMKVASHQTVHPRWQGPGFTVYSTVVNGETVYRASKTALARIYMEHYKAEG